MKSVTQSEAILSLKLLRAADQCFNAAVMSMARREIGDMVNYEAIEACPGATKRVNALYDDGELLLLGQAIEILKRSINANPYLPSAHVSLAMAYAEVGNNADDCLASFDNALLLDPGDMKVLFSKTWCLIDNDRHEEALVAISQLEKSGHEGVDWLKREFADRQRDG